ncbi:MAG: hypothetical protein LBN39_11030 [Planctomycetaceae bacterium]|nr:hypothetical protein [Planctomycetaceae bacterium]
MPSFIWLESENPATTVGVEKLNSWENPYFSGKWLHLSVDADKLDAQIQGNEVVFRYEFESGVTENFELWNRVGFEYVRSPFDWRLDNGDWKTAKPDDLTVDLMEVGFWCEIAWLKLGNVDLQKGKHTLEIRLPKRKNADGKPERILYASDCLCLYPGKFAPYSKFKPNEDHRTEKDREAAQHVFPAAPEIRLSGTWEICRDDELLPEPVATPISRLPNTNRWSAITVPGDKNTLRPDLQFAHRIWYRTKFEASTKTAFLEFPQNNLNTTVYVNGQLCGFNKNPFAKFHIDISNAVKTGTNELYVGIRDVWYGYSENPSDPMKLRRRFNLPKSYIGQGFQDLSYPVWNRPQSGILLEPAISFKTSPVYIDDVFVKTSVAKNEIELEVTLKNTSDQDQQIEFNAKCFPKDDGNSGGDSGKAEPAKVFEQKRFLVKANSEQVVNITEKWENPKRWTPQKPFLYQLHCSLNEKDVEKYNFGFREWSIDGKNFLLNGVPFHGWADTFNAESKEDWLAFYRNSNQTVMRFWGPNWKGMSPDETLDFFDQNGVVVRRTGGELDGQMIGYMAIESDPALRERNKAALQKAGDDPKKEELKLDLLQNWREQVCAQVKGERNHPSVMIWSTDNEWLYINCINLYGGLMDQFEDEYIKTVRAVKGVDPTRASMPDGGGATKSNALEVQGDHYVFDDFTKYPDRAYEPFTKGGGRGRWEWDQKRPRFIGEDFYVNGMHPSEFAVFGGEEAFAGRTGAKKGVGILYKMLTEGYRWSEYGAWHFWVDQSRASAQYSSNAPIAVFCKEYDWTFESGETVNRTLKIFNDTQEKETITLNWEVCFSTEGIPSRPDVRQYRLPTGYIEKDGQWICSGSKKFEINAGCSGEYSLQFPVIRIDLNERDRAEGKLILSLTTQKKGESVESFRDEKELSIVHLAPTFISLVSPPGSRDNSNIPGCILLYDPHHSITTYLKENNVEYTAIENLNDLSAAREKLVKEHPPLLIGGKTREKVVLIVGKDAIESTNSDSPQLQAFASQGNSVVVLEQKNPLRYGALPCEIDFSENEGRTAFIENENHRVFEWLKNKDFFTWADGHLVYRNAYKKPVRGARSLLQCGQRLENSAVVEIPVGEGLMILSQTLIGEKLAKSVVAKQLLGNMIQYASEYELKFTPVVLCKQDADPRLLVELDAMQLKYTTVDEPNAALQNLQKSTVILSATPRNLKSIFEHQKEVEQFYQKGGTILLHGLTPEGLENFNKFVGVEHLIRPFVREKVVFPPKRNPLTLGLSLNDIAMSSGEKMFGWANDEYVASDTYSYVVDIEDVAPFAKYENDFVKMMSNGMGSADGWPYIVNVPAPNVPPLDFTLKFPKEQEITEVTWTGNTFYYPVTKFGLFFDGKSSQPAMFNVEPNTEPQTFSVEPPIRGKDLTLRLADWTVLPDKGQTTGLDNIELKVRRSEEFYKKVKPLLNIGAMVQYQMNHGSVVLCNLKFQENEAVPANTVKKRNILATILRNLGAEFSETKSIIAGTPLQYEQIDISKQCNEFRSERGWFGDKAFTFVDLPRGLQKFGAVPFEIYDFPTSPVPNCIAVKAEDVRGIPVTKKADAIFFFHTGKIDRRRNRDEIRDGKQFELFKYVVRYTDGKTIEIPIISEVDIDNYKQQNVVPISGATLGWVRKYEGTDQTAVAYVKQWTNPHPESVIESIDLVHGKDNVGSAAVLGITVARMTAK